MNTTELVVVQGTKLRLDYHRWQTFEYMKWALKLLILLLKGWRILN